jgi:hypothetical protein
MFMQNRNTIIESGFKILTGLLTWAADLFIKYRKELHILLKNGLLSEDPTIKLAAIEALSA